MREVQKTSSHLVSAQINLCEAALANLLADDEVADGIGGPPR